MCGFTVVVPHTVAGDQPGSEPFTLDDTNLYYYNFLSGTLLSSPKAGGDAVTLVPALGAPSHLVVDSSFVYWTEDGSGKPGAVKRVPKSGGAVTVIAEDALGLAMGNGSLYFWTQGGTVLNQVATGGGALVTVASGTPEVTEAQDLVIGSESAYWFEYHEIRSAPVSGGTSTPFATTYASALALTDTKLYWLDASLHPEMQLFGANLDGSEAQLLRTFPPVQTDFSIDTVNFAVDSSAVYWWSMSGQTLTLTGSIMRMTVDGGPPTALCSGPDPLDGIVVDDAYVYWRNGAIMRVAK